MRTQFDQFAKHVVEGALTSSCTVQTEVEVAAEVQKIDAWVEPDDTRAGERLLAGLLGRIAATPCLVEAYHRPPTALNVRECVQKQLALHARQRRAARAAKHPTPSLPLLWIVSAGDPVRVRRGFRMRPLEHFVRGCYRGAPALRLRLVVVPELPRVRDTLLVRLMGAGPTLRGAIADLRALPSDAWERRAAMPWLRILRLTYEPNPPDSGEDTEAIMNAVELAEQLSIQDREDGRVEELQRLFARRLGRFLRADEQDAIRRRARTHGWEALEQVLFERKDEDLAAWLVNSEPT